MKNSKKIIIIILTFVFIAVSATVTIFVLKSTIHNDTKTNTNSSKITQNTSIYNDTETKEKTSALDLLIAEAKSKVANNDSAEAKILLQNALKDYTSKNDADAITVINFELYNIDHPDAVPYTEADAKVSD